MLGARFLPFSGCDVEAAAFFRDGGMSFVMNANSGAQMHRCV